MRISSDFGYRELVALVTNLGGIMMNKRERNYSFWTMTAIALSVGGFSSTTLADEASLQLEEIVVTARKRNDIRTTPKGQTS